jgi:hypothetical protein
VTDKIRELFVAPRFWLWFHAVMAAKWLLLFVPGMWLWPMSVPFLMYVSLTTALATALAGFGAALGARKADPDDPL